MSCIAILTGRNEVAAYVEDVRHAGDGDKAALGFLPSTVYEDFANSGSLFVAIDDGKYAGHVAFGGVYPHVKVWQMHVSSEYRGKGVGRRLFGTLKEHAESRGCISIRASVTADLEANAFWEAVGLRTVRQKAGGSSKNRTINVRELLLGKSDLLASLRDDMAANDVGAVRLRSMANRSSYVLDVNVLLDALRRQGETQDAAIRLLGSALSNRIVIGLSAEGYEEIARNFIPGRPDPLSVLARAIPGLPALPADRISHWETVLRPLVFPSVPSVASLSSQQASDLRHLGTAIELRRSGLVTRDMELLAARPQVLGAYGVDILAPSDLLEEIDVNPNISTFVPAITDATLDIVVGAAGKEVAAAALSQVRARFAQAEPELAARLSTSSSVYLVARRRGEVVAIGWGGALGTEEAARWFFVFFEDTADRWLIADHFLAHLLLQAPPRPVAVRLELFGADDSVVEHLKSRGCLASTHTESSSTSLIKLIVSGFVELDQWPGLCEWIERSVGLRILSAPATINSSHGRAECRTESGDRRSVDWFSLESALSPVLYLFRAGFGLIVPIKSWFAEELLGARQSTVLPVQPARLRTERVYFKDARGLEVSKGMPIIFRESLDGGRGSGAAIGCARLVSYEVLETSIAKEKYRRQGVMDLDRYEVGATTGRVGVVTFDGFQEFPRPVNLDKLRNFGAVGGSQNVTTERIPMEAVSKVLKWGFKRD